MMNRYQRAFYKISLTIEAKVDDYKLLRELVDKATPIKVEHGNDCPICVYGRVESEHGDRYNYCSNCGKAFLWD
jgi:uncharacterized protein (DUF983 family)